MIVPSIGKGKHGFDGPKCAHTASSALIIRQVFSAALSLSGRISAPAKLPAPDRNGFPSDFCFLRRRRAAARQGEKGKKCRKGALSGVSALVNRWYPQQCKAENPPVVIAVLGVWMCFAARQPTDGSLAPGWYRRAGTGYVPPLQGRGEHGLPENDAAGTSPCVQTPQGGDSLSCPAEKPHITRKKRYNRKDW